eukprot:scaffold9920_cov122-Isochrysis_galbana.AAC.6
MHYTFGVNCTCSRMYCTPRIPDLTWLVAACRWSPPEVADIRSGYLSGRAETRSVSHAQRHKIEAQSEWAQGPGTGSAVTQSLRPPLAHPGLVEFQIKIDASARAPPKRRTTPPSRCRRSRRRCAR